MLAAMYYRNNDLRIQEMPKPGIGSREILMEVEASGICGTDVLEWYRLKKVPLVLGHEVSGTIVEKGDEVKEYELGQRIAAAHHVPCNICHYCKMGHQTVCDTLRKTNFFPGGFTQYIRLPEINVKTGVLVLPEELSFEQATFIEPLGCVIRGQRLAGFKAGMSVLVIGSGVSGLLHIKLAKIHQASKIFATDIQEYRLKAAKEFGADVVFNAKEINPDKLRQANDGRLVDLAIVCTGASSVYQQALQLVERGGIVLFFAATEPGFVLPLGINEVFWRNEIALISSYGASPQDCKASLDLIAQKNMDLDKMITHRLGLSEIALGFRLVAEAKESLKVIINPQR